MKTCPQCRRHLFASDERCPFCGCEQREASARLAPAASLLGLVIAAVSCGPAVDDNPADSGSTSEVGTDPTAPGTTSSSGSAPTSMPGTGPAATSEPGGSTGVETTTSGAMTSDSTAAEDSTGTSDIPTSGGFIYGAPDMGPGTKEECSLLEQDCLRRDEKCNPWANDGGDDLNATRCVPLDPDPGAPGEACVVEGSAVSGIDSCAEAAVCLGVDLETNEGICFALCSEDPEIGDFPCTDPALECQLHASVILSVCVDPCGCEDGEACIVGNDGQTDCVPPT